MAKTRPEVKELGGQNIGFLFGTMMDLRMLPTDIKHTGNVEVGEFRMVAHFPAVHEKNGTEAQYLAKHRTFRGGLYATYQDGPYKIDEIKWDATNKAGVHMVTKTKYGQIVEFPTQPSKTMPGSMKLMVQEYVESLKQPQLVIRCSGLGGALEPVANTTDEYQVILLNGDIKCPKSMHSHVPAKYHAEDDGRFDAQIGPWSFNAEEILSGSPGLQHHDLTRRRDITEVQDIEIVVNINWETEEKVDTKYQQDLQSWANNVIDYWMHDNREKIIDDEYGDWSDTWYSSDDGHDEDIEVIVQFNWQLDSLNEGHSDYQDEHYWEYDAENFEASQRSGSDAGMGLCGGCKKQGQLMNFGRRKMCYDCAMERYGAEFNAYSDPITQRQKWKINDLGGTVKNNMNRSQASDYIKDLMGVPSGTWKAEDKHDGFGDYKKPPWVSVGRRTRFMRDKKKRRQMERKKAETFEAASTAPPNLSREQNNVLQAVKAQYPGFSWKTCDWGPYFLRFSEDGSNKFYSVWVWESRSGIYTAMGAYGGLGQNPRLFNITQTRDLQSAINEAQKKMNSKTRKGYNTYKSESFEASYTGSGALSDVGLSTDQLTSTWGSGDFDKSSLNSSGHMNVFANAESENEELQRLRRLVANLPDSICRCCGDSKWTGDGIDFMCVNCEELGECEYCKGDKEFNAPLGFNEMGSRPFYGNPRKIAIDRWGNARFIRRRKDGTYMKNVDVGRSLAMDRRRQSKTWAPPGYRDQGDGSPSLLERLRFRGE